MAGHVQSKCVLLKQFALFERPEGHFPAMRNDLCKLLVDVGLSCSLTLAFRMAGQGHGEHAQGAAPGGGGQGSPGPN